MSSPRFLIAKYAPDIHRMEPRNFGIIAWSNGAAKARFLGERAPGKIYPPSMVSKDSRDAYRQWIKYWRIHLSRPAIKSRRGVIDRNSSEFIDALRETSKEQFMLADGGYLLDQISPEQLDAVVDDLFGTLVEQPTASGNKAEHDSIVESCRSIFEKTGLRQREDFKAGVSVIRAVGGKSREFLIDYHFGEIGRPACVLQRILLGRHQSVDSAAFMFTNLGLPKNRLASLVSLSRLPDDPDSRRRAEQGYDLLESYSTPIDVDHPSAIAAVTAIASYNGHH